MQLTGCFSQTCPAPLNLITSVYAIHSAESALLIGLILCHSKSSPVASLESQLPCTWLTAPSSESPAILEHPSARGKACNWGHACLLTGLELFGRHGLFFIHPYVVSSTVLGAYLTQFSRNGGERRALRLEGRNSSTKHQPAESD